MKKVEQKGNTQLPAVKSWNQLVRLTPENEAPIETIVNPFTTNGIRIKDENPNPFIKY